MTNNFIELNGNRYDATTGAFLGKVSQSATTIVAPTSISEMAKPVKPRTASPGGIMSDVVWPKAAHVQRAHHHVAAHHPQHARTLRRDAVKPPAIKRKMSLKAQAPADLVPFKSGVLALKPKLSSEIVDVNRATRAQTVPQSTKIERFRPLHAATPRQYNDNGVVVTMAHIPVKQPPVPTTGIVGSVRNTGHSAQVQTTTKKDDIFEQALARATSHEQPAPREVAAHKVKRAHRRHKRAVQFVTSTLVLLLLGGFIFWQNRASVEMQFAAARSGVAASLPSYKPAGFAFKNLTYSSGSVTLKFGGDNNKTYSVVQKSSNWDSQTLLENYVSTADQPYNAYSAAGRTVYVYGNGDATWVNGGIWYQVNDDGVLTKDQIINLATSM